MEHVAEWDVAEFLEDEEAMAAYLNAVIDNGEPSDITKALGDIARAKGMTKVARETGFTRDGLYKALSATGNPSITLVSEVLASLGLKLRVAAL